MKKICKSICSKPKIFARTFWNSLTDPAYYRDVLQAKLSFSLRYFFALSFIISVASTLLAFLTNNTFLKNMGGVIPYLFMGFAVYFLTSLLSLLLPSLILFVGAKIAKRKLSFAKTYQMSLHGATIPVTLSFLFGFSGLNPYVSIASWLAFFVFMFVVISKLDPRPGI